MTDRSLEPIIYAVFLLLGIVVLGYVLLRLFIQRKARKTSESRMYVPAIDGRVTYCFCGQAATHRATRTGRPLLRDTEWWVRMFTGEPSLRQRYRPEAPEQGEFTLCAHHRRTWDATLRRQMISVIDIAEADLHQAVAQQMAAFEGAELQALVEATMTPAQVKLKKNLEAARVKPSGKQTVTILSPDAFQKGADVVERVVPAAEVGQCPPSPVPGVLS